MKFFAFIMACIVLLLSVMPCMDNGNETNANKAKAEFSKSNNKQPQHPDTDNCSPFCSCNCCAGITYFPATYQAMHLVFPSAEKATALISAKASKIALPVWQPPQLV